MTTLGAGTLYGYLLHGFLIRGARFLGGYDDPFLETPSGRVAVTLAAALVVTALCTPPVRRVFRYVVEPRMEWARAAGTGPVPPTYAQPSETYTERRQRELQGPAHRTGRPDRGGR
ncbi:hypothetical protein ACIBBB_09860 [Streptomyces sp. NPDC051217]|uniref:hypothetical protein n=1 Tax=Streptomyces sp. NPDC051217 TaxID=3365644 RepID=UPI0037A7A046